jgi:hypothetical protein
MVGLAPEPEAPDPDEWDLEEGCGLGTGWRLSDIETNFLFGFPRRPVYVERSWQYILPVLPRQ